MVEKDLTKNQLPVEAEDAPIEIFFGNIALDIGMGSVPRMLALYWPYLSHHGEVLSEIDYALIIQVLLLRQREEYDLRVSNLPMKVATDTRERSKARLRNMGLIFTQRIYYDPQPGRKTPRMKCQRWDFRSLFYNLEQVARFWMAGQGELLDAWNGKGYKPVYKIPTGYTHETILPPDLALDIAKGMYFPISAYWKEQANLTLKSLPEIAERTCRIPTGTSRTNREVPSSQGERTCGFPTSTARTGGNPRDHLLIKEDEGGGEISPLARSFLAFFSKRLGVSHTPTGKENAAAEKLAGDGFTLEEVQAGIELSFHQAKSPVKHFTYCAKIIRQQRQSRPADPETHKPASRQPEAGDLESSNAKNDTAPQLVIDADLTPAAEVYRASGNCLTDPVLARLRIMADRCQDAALKTGSTGPQWVTDALRMGLGVAKNGSLLNYGDSVLSGWISNGRPEPTKPKRGSAKSSTKQDGVKKMLDLLGFEGGGNGNPG